MARSTTPKYTYQWYIKQFEDAKARCQTLTSSNQRDTLFHKPASDIWSAVECLGHLVSFGNIYYNNIQRALEQAQTDEAEASTTFKPRLLWLGVIRIFEPPYKLKFKTLSIFEPSPQEQTQKNEGIFNDFLNLQDRFIDQLKRCEQQGINLGSTKVSNPALKFVKMTLAECYALADAHQRRHLWQAEQILSHK